MSQTSQYLIYGLVDPRTNQLRYIGLSSCGLRRPKAHTTEYHLYRPDLKSNRFSHKQRWLQGLIAAGFQPDIVILEECSSREALNEAEIFNIQYYRSIGCNLTNHQPGGYAGRKGGWNHPVETIEKLRKSAKLRYEKDPSSIKKAIASRKLISEKHKQVNGKSLKARWQDPVKREALIASLKGRPSPKRIPLVDQFGNTYASITEAAKATNTAASNIRKQLNGKLKRVKQFIFSKKVV
jgi:hypothetical protein